jgi:hypothetical protein
VSLPDGKKPQDKRKPNATASPAIFLFEKPEASYVAATEDLKRNVTFQEVKITRGTKHQYEKDVKIRTSQPRPADPATGRIHARMALLKARILQSNIRNKPRDKERTFIREDWEGADCQVHFNDPEDMESQSSEEFREVLFESQYEWLDEGQRVAASRSIFVQGPVCMSTLKHQRNEDSEEDDTSDEEESRTRYWPLAV